MGFVSPAFWGVGGNTALPLTIILTACHRDSSQIQRVASHLIPAEPSLALPWQRGRKSFLQGKENEKEDGYRALRVENALIGKEKERAHCSLENW